MVKVGILIVSRNSLEDFQNPLLTTTAQTVMDPEAKPFLSENDYSSHCSNHDLLPADRPIQKRKLMVQLVHVCLISLYTIASVTVILPQKLRQVSSLHRKFTKHVLLWLPALMSNFSQKKPLYNPHLDYPS